MDANLKAPTPRQIHQHRARLTIVCVLLGACRALHGQADERTASEPAPVFGPQQTVPSKAQLPPGEAGAKPGADTGVVTGKVTDEDGTPIAGAKVTLTRPSSSTQAATITDSEGMFRFERVAPGAFTLAATSPGLVSEGTDGVLAAGATLAMQAIELLAASTSAEVDVVASQHDVAQAEIGVEEHQRLLGILPNYYVAYNWHAAPLSAGQKTELARKTLLDPVNLGIVVLSAGIQQATGALSGYGPGAEGYGARLGANLANFASGTLIGGLILPALLHQDPRFFYRGSGSVWSRTGWALAQAVISRSDKGKWQPAYAAIGGDLISGAISNLYYPENDRTGAGLAIENGLLAIGEDAIGNVIQEFVFKHLTPHAPKYPGADGTSVGH